MIGPDRLNGGQRRIAPDPEWPFGHSFDCPACGATVHDGDLASKPAPPSKQTLLDHYARREPKRFYRLDAFGAATSDMFANTTWELVNGSQVRVLIDPETPRELAADLLEEPLDWWRRGPEFEGYRLRPLPVADGLPF